MVKGTDVHWDGVQKLFAEYDLSKESAQELTEKAIRETLSKAQQKSMAIAPVKTGYMKQNIKVSIEESSADRVVGKINAQADYSSFIENGTFKMAARPFINPSVKASTPWFYSAVKRALKNVGNGK